MSNSLSSKSPFRFFAVYLIILVTGTISAAFAQTDNIGDRATTWGDWPTWGDQGDGTYLNPVLPADYSDIDCIRVGNDYYAISSTFQYSPGVVILHSVDMVNWTIIGHAVTDVTQISPNMNWDKMNEYGDGVWAGSIRFYNNKFWIYFGTPNEGYFMTTAADPAGPWAPLTQVLASSGWDDCCPFWDDDGQEYFVGTNYANNYTTYIYKMSADGTQILTSTGVVIHTGSGGEANKLYKINGIYYHIFSMVVSGIRVVMGQQATSVMGPYTATPQQLTESNAAANQPNQGGLVQAVNGNWYFYTHHGAGAWEGRCDSLLPVEWVNGWPIIGTVDSNGLGLMTWSGVKPVEGGPLATPSTSDEFNETALPQQWEWNYQPRSAYWSLTARPGWLRLMAFTPLFNDSLTAAGNTLTQRSFRTNYNQVIAKVDISGMTTGQKAGLCHFTTSSPAQFGAVQSGTTRSLELKIGSTITSGPVLTGTNLWLSSSWGLNGVSQFSYSTDGVNFTNFGPTYQLQWASYRGDRIGLYSYNNSTNSGQLDVDYFRYVIQPPTPTVLAVAGSGQVTLSWSQVREASGYQVYRATSSGGPYTAVGPVTTGLTYTDTGLQNDTTYYYIVTTIPISPATAATSVAVSAFPIPVTSINHGLVTRLQFDQSSGSTAFDSSGNNENATLINGPSWVAGEINNAINFNGTNQYGTLPAGVVSGLTGNFSVTAWVCPQAATTWQRIFDFGTGQGAYMFLTPVSSSGNVRFAITVNGTGGEQQINGTAPLPVGVWSHVAVTLSGTTGTLYVNGAVVGTNTAMTLTPASLGSTTQNYLGKSQFSDPYLNGSIDEFQISSQAFTAAQIANMANPPAPPLQVTATGGMGQVNLGWNAVSSAGYFYNIRRSTTSGGPYSVIAENQSGTSYTDSNVTAGTTYYYVVTTANSLVESADSTEVSATPLAAVAPNLLSVASVQSHAGTLYSIPLPLTGNEGIECRQIKGALSLVFTFAGPVASGDADVTEGAGSVENVACSGNTMTVTLSGVTDAQNLTVTVSNINTTSGSDSVSFGVLLGDVNGDGLVSVLDSVTIRNDFNQAAGSSGFNPRADLNEDGLVSVLDSVTVRNSFNHQLP